MWGLVLKVAFWLVPKSWIRNAVKGFLIFLIAVTVFSIMGIASIFAQPFGNWWLAGVTGAHVARGPIAPVTGPPPISVGLPSGGVPPSSDINLRALETARTWIGVPYVFGGTTRSGVDCSGLFFQSYAAVGVLMPRKAQAQYGVLSRIPTSEARPGDAIVFARTYDDPTDWITHIGFISRVGPDGIFMIDAPGTGGYVREEPVVGFWVQRFAGIGRYVPPGPPPNQA